MSRIAGKRNARRIAAVCPIRLWGMDAGGKPFIEAATTVNVSYTGVLLKDVPAKLSVGDTIALRSGEHKCRFRVVWLGSEGTPDAGHLGLQSLDSENPIWDDLNLPAHSIDIYSRPHESEHRLISRSRCLISAEVGGNDSAGRVRTFLTDITPGGCYVSLATPWPVEAKLTLGFWLEERNRIWADGIVISQHQGLGMGIKFLNLSRKNLEDLTRFIELLPQQQTLSPVRADS